MRDFFIEVFSEYSRVIVFLHVVSAALLIGSLFAMRFVLRPIEVDAPDVNVKFGHCLKVIQRYMIFVAILMSTIIITSLFMHLGLGFKSGHPTTYVFVHIKEALWTFIVFNFTYVFFKYKRAKKGLNEGNYTEVEENFILILRYFIPLNLILTIISVYFGVVLRGF